MAKKASKSAAGQQITDKAKALVLAALDRAGAVLKLAEHGGKPEDLAPGSYPVDVLVRITGDITVAEPTVTEETTANVRTFTAGDVLCAMVAEMSDEDREEAITRAVMFIAKAQKAGESGEASARLRSIAELVSAFTDAQAMKRGLMESRTTGGTTRRGAVAGKPSVSIEAVSLGGQRDVELTFRCLEVAA
jgi:hypothetical protein